MWQDINTSDVNISDEDFSALITELKKAYYGQSNLTPRDLKQMTEQVCGVLRDTLNIIIEAIEKDEETNNQPSTSSVCSSDSITLIRSDVTTPDSAPDPQQTINNKIDNSTRVIKDSTSGSAVATPSKPQAQPDVQKTLGVLERIAVQLRSFYQWLKEKAKKIASDIWNAVRQAFSNMLAWIRSIANKVGPCSTGGFTANAKVHMA